MGSFQAMEEDSKTSSNVTTSEDTKEETAKDSKVEFSEDEETLIARMFRLVGDRWNLIEGRIPGRSAEEIKKYWTSKSVSSSTKQHD
ncbi:Transcription factor CPC [Vitis vinifera]|uniref:Transcription factor CPC n=1 Tax=Vitis vinifera TaxID=29760 RepID=A0A438JG12_VITVI|nr:Transcription factor CPC [Vitis vinifera]